MERGSGFHRYRSRHAKQPATPSSAHNSLNLQVSNSNAAGNFPNPISSSNGNGTMAVPQDPRPGPQSAMREQDQYMPIANVIRIMRRILPAHAKISDDAKETIQECVSEYISFITGEANDRCQREQRKTITADDVLWAMGKLGFDDYVEPLSVFISRYRESENERTSVRDPILKRSASLDYGNDSMPPYGSVYPTIMGNHPGIYDLAGPGGYYRNASGAAAASSSQNPLANFDPFAQLK